MNLLLFRLMSKIMDQSMNGVAILALVVSTFHKISGASLAYEYKMADIIKCLREDFKVYAKEV